MIFHGLHFIVLVAVLAAFDLLYRGVKRIDLATLDLPNVFYNKINAAELRLYEQIEALTLILHLPATIGSFLLGRKLQRAQQAEHK